MGAVRQSTRSGLLTFVGALLLLGGFGAAATAVVGALVGGGSMSLEGVHVGNDNPAAWKRLAIASGVLAVVLLTGAGFCLSAAGRRRRLRKNRPKYGHRMTTQRHWQGQLRAGVVVSLLIGLAALTVAGVLIANQRDRSGDRSTLLVPAGIAGGFGLLLIGLAVSWRRQLRARQRALALQSASLDRERPAWSPPTAPAGVAPPAGASQFVHPAGDGAAQGVTAPPVPFQAQLIRPRDLPKGRVKPQSIADGRNLIGAQPIDILYLRVFDNHERARTYVESAWREFGYVNLIRNAASVTARELRDGVIERSMVRTIDDARLAYAARPRGVDTKKRKKVVGVGFAPTHVRDPVGSYPVFSLFCHDSAWQAAVEMLLDHAGLVTMDLAGVDTDNPGSLYEVGRLFDRYPIDRVLFLVDPRSDVEFIVRNMRPQWARMHPDSLNRRAQQVVTFVQTDRYVQRRDQNGNSTTALVADRKASRRVFAAWTTGHLHGRPVQ